MVTVRLSTGFALLMLIVSRVACAQDVTVEASLDRQTIRENESFLYTLRAEGAVRGNPELSSLEENFEIIDTRNTSSVRIINGQMDQVTEWQIQMIPKQAGQFTLAPVRVGGVESNSLTLEVLPAASASNAPADIFMEVDVDSPTVYVQSQIIFTLRLFVGVGTGRATLSTPQVSGGEAIVERIGEDGQFRTTRDGQDFIVRERRYAVFPQEPGALTIGPATFEAMVIPSRGFSRVQRFRSDSVSVEVLPAVPPPPEFPNAVWLPASRLTLAERWSDEPAQFELGIPRTRTLSIEADGLLETQLPELELGQAEGIRQYADQPELDRDTSASGLAASRTERYAVIAQRAGVVEMPGVSLPWWNVAEERWETASIEPRLIDVLPSAETVIEPESTVLQPDESAPEPNAGSGAWPFISAFFGLGWAVTALLWWRSRQPSNAERDDTRLLARARWAENRRLLKSLRAACVANDAEAAQSLILEYARLRFPDDPPATLGALGQRLPDAARSALNELESSLYGRGGRDWNGTAVLSALESLEAVSATGKRKRADALLPLYR